MMHIVFDYKDYIDYLSDRLEAFPQVRGSRAALAKFLGCQSSFVSQVLTRRAHLSREQAIRVTEFLELSHEERRFFMMLVDLERAGSKALEDFYRQEIEEVLLVREEVRENIGVRDRIPDEAQTIYYSSWIYGTVHILSAFPQFNSVPAIARHLRLPLLQVEEVVRWLIAQGLVNIDSHEKLEIGKGRVHLEKHSRHVVRHHTNWRIKVLDSLDRTKPEDLHYSAVLGISKEATKLLKQKLLEFLREAEPIISEAPVEQVTVLLLDLFEI
jgi:uncharacterized protein (TIGR02147 family)